MSHVAAPRNKLVPYIEGCNKEDAGQRLHYKECRYVKWFYEGAGRRTVVIY